MKNRNLNRIAAAVYSEPWLILPSQHAVIRGIVEAHITGEAHLPDGCASMFESKPPEEAGHGYTIRDGVAVVPAVGTLALRVGMLEAMSGMTDFLDIQHAIEDAAADPQAEAILLAIDSPGGTYTGTPETATLIATTDKPIVAFTDSGMASAAYWLGSQAEAIVATESARVGSIGVYMALLDESVAYTQAGFKQELFKSGKFKGMGMPGVPLTDDQRELLQRSVNDIFEDFRDTVLNQRPDVPADAMEGQTFRADEALELGLIDQIGGIGAALTLAREIAASKKE